MSLLVCVPPLPDLKGAGDPDKCRRQKEAHCGLTVTTDSVPCAQAVKTVTRGHRVCLAWLSGLKVRAELGEPTGGDSSFNIPA